MQGPTRVEYRYRYQQPRTARRQRYLTDDTDETPYRDHRVIRPTRPQSIPVGNRENALLQPQCIRQQGYHSTSVASARLAVTPVFAVIALLLRQTLSDRHQRDCDDNGPCLAIASWCFRHKRRIFRLSPPGFKAVMIAVTDNQKRHIGDTVHLTTSVPHSVLLLPQPALFHGNTPQRRSMLVMMTKTF